MLTDVSSDCTLCWACSETESWEIGISALFAFRWVHVPTKENEEFSSSPNIPLLIFISVKKIIARFAWISWTSIYFSLMVSLSPYSPTEITDIMGHGPLELWLSCCLGGLCYGLTQGQQRVPLWLFCSKGRPGSCYWPDFCPVLYTLNCKEATR